MASITTIKILKTIKGEYIEVPFTEYFHNINETSYKRWSLKNTSQNWNNGAWQMHDLEFNLFSTGKSCLCGKVLINGNLVALNWRIELLDNNKNEISTINFAPIVFNNPKSGKARKVKFEKRIRDLDLELISQVNTIRVYPE